MRTAASENSDQKTIGSTKQQESPEHIDQQLFRTSGTIQDRISIICDEDCSQ